MLDTTARTYVIFLDMQEVAALHNVELKVDRAEKCPANPVLPLGDVHAFDQRTAASWAGSVLFDEEEQVFKLWYFAESSAGLEFGAIGYAWSEDGVDWHKPALGLYEYRGDRNNNIVFKAPTGCKVQGKIAPDRSDHFIIAKDYRESDPNKRYKGWSRMYSPRDERDRYFPVYSPDGLHWTVGPAPVAYPTIDATNLVIDDGDPDPGRRIKFYGNYSGPQVLGHGDMGYGPDIEHCAPSPHNPVLNPHDGLEHTIHLFSGLPYRGHYLALYDPDLWLDYYDYKEYVDWRARDPRVPAPKTGIFVGDIRLASNRDGVSPFRRVNPHQPLVARGERGMWDSGFLVITNAIVRHDRIYIFYSAATEAAGALPHGAAAWVSSSVSTGLATLRLDGFTHLETRDGLAPGQMTTLPIRVQDPARARLIVNASHLMAYRDWIEVEVLDSATNEPLPGYGRRDCRDLAREGLRLPVQWAEQATFAGVTVPEIKLRFTLYGKARLYAFTFAE
jgi:hypothetical protein